MIGLKKAVRALVKWSEADAVEKVLEEYKDIKAKRIVPDLQLVEKEVLALIGDRSRTTHAVNNDEIPPRALAYLLTASCIFHLLASGRHHIYRGILSGTGQSLLRSYRIAVQKCRETGLESDESVDQLVNGLLEILKSEG